MVAPATQLYRSTLPETLADVRHYADRCPESLCWEPRILARMLRQPEAEVAIAQAWMLADGLEVRV